MPTLYELTRAQFRSDPRQILSGLASSEEWKWFFPIFVDTDL